MHLTLRRIELTNLGEHHRAQSQGALSLNMGITTDMFSSMSGDTTLMAEGQHISTR
jgi:hypothetical protein